MEIKFDQVKSIANGIYNADFKKLLKTLVIVILFSITGIAIFFCYQIAKNTQITQALVENMFNEQDEASQLAVRDNIVTPQIQKDISRLCYSVNADRVIIIEFHNGKVNGTNLPFTFMDMSYEEVNDLRGVERIADNYLNVPISHYKYPERLRQVKCELVTTEEMQNYDRLLASKMLIEHGQIGCFGYLISNGKPIGILACFWDNKNDCPENCVDIVKNYAIIISNILDMSKIK